MVLLAPMLCALALVSSRPAACPADSDAFAWLRTADPTIADALRLGMARSPRFRQLAVQVLDACGIVYFQVRASLPRKVLAALRPEVHGSGGTRYLVVQVRPGVRGDHLVATLGHELQHAVELLNAPEARSRAECLAVFRAIGFRVRSDVYETEAALRAGEQIARELSSAPHLAPTGPR